MQPCGSGSSIQCITEPFWFPGLLLRLFWVSFLQQVLLRKSEGLWVSPEAASLHHFQLMWWGSQACWWQKKGWVSFCLWGTESLCECISQVHMRNRWIEKVLCLQRFIQRCASVIHWLMITLVPLNSRQLKHFAKWQRHVLRDNVFIWVSEQVSTAAAFYPVFIYLIGFFNECAFK